MPYKIGTWWKLQSIDYWSELIGMSPDPRTHHLLWINASPLFILWKIFNFVMFAKILGPELMRELPAFDVRWLMFLYNCCMSFINIYAVWNVIPMSGYFRIIFDFEYPDRQDISQRSIHLIHLGYLYWLSKILDCWDTSFFVVRKKFKQITLLHVYHHTVVPVFGYILMRVNVLTPCVFLFSFVNSVIHVIMYSYYALAALGPWIQPYLWWKKYITIMQLWQFVLYGIYGGFLLIFSKNYPKFWLYFGLTQPPLFFWLFFDFYMKAYNTKNLSVMQLLRKFWKGKSNKRLSQNSDQKSMKYLHDEASLESKIKSNGHHLNHHLNHNNNTNNNGIKHQLSTTNPRMRSKRSDF